MLRATLQSTTSGTTSHYEVLGEVHRFFRDITRHQLHQLATTFFMDKIKVFLSSNSDIYFGLNIKQTPNSSILRF